MITQGSRAEGTFLQRFLIEGGDAAVVPSVDQGSLTGDGDHFLHGRDIERGVDLRVLADLQTDAVTHDGGEPAQLELDRVGADGQRREAVDAGGSGHRGLRPDEG
jgi:hypothetical protein